MNRDRLHSASFYTHRFESRAFNQNWFRLQIKYCQSRVVFYWLFLKISISFIDINTFLPLHRFLCVCAILSREFRCPSMNITQNEMNFIQTSTVRHSLVCICNHFELRFSYSTISKSKNRCNSFFCCIKCATICQNDKNHVSKRQHCIHCKRPLECTWQPISKNR